MTRKLLIICTGGIARLFGVHWTAPRHATAKAAKRQAKAAERTARAAERQ